MARRRQSQEGEVRQRPAWIIPLLLALGVAIFSGFFLYHYFGPSTSELLGRDPKASAQMSRIDATIAGVSYLVPENYTRYPSQRGSGVKSELGMHALLLDFRGYSPDLAEDFADNSPTSKVIFFNLRETADILPPERRLKEIYARYLVSQTPVRDSTGLERFEFKEDSGFKGQDLLVGMSIDGRLVLLTCQQQTKLVDSPNCSGSMELKSNLAVNYRYKRAFLTSWQEIDEGLYGLLRSFETSGS